MHPTFAKALAPFAPPQSSVHAQVGDRLNDDDTYLIDVTTKRVLQRYGCKSAMAEAARYNGIGVRTGQALLTGIQARKLGVTA